MSRTLLVGTIVVLVGLVAYLIGATFPLRPAPTIDAPSVDVRDEVVGAAVPRGVGADERTEAFLRETRAANRELREAVALLTTALADVRNGPNATQESNSAVPPAEQWAARLRAREPDVVMERVCGLRERLLTRALTLDEGAKAPMPRIVGGTPEDLAAAPAKHAAEIQYCRDEAVRCRVADKELDAVRTIEDLARWRTRNDLVDR